MAEKSTGVSPQDAVARPVKPPSELEGAVMQITVTDAAETRVHFVQKALLHRKSPYFVALSNFEEGKESHVKLDDIKHDAFRNLLSWLYRDFLDPVFADDSTVLMQTWAAADRLMMSKCKNMVMDALRETYSTRYCNVHRLAAVDSLEYTSDSVLAQFIIDQIAYDCVFEDYSGSYGLERQFTRALEGMKGTMVIGLVLKIIARARKYEKSKTPDTAMADRPSNLKGCHYHEHVEGEKCYLEEDK